LRGERLAAINAGRPKKRKARETLRRPAGGLGALISGRTSKTKGVWKRK